MNRSQTTTQSTTEQASQAGDSLQRITQSVDTISSMNTQIAAAAQQQGSVAEEISANINRISEISEQSSVAANQMAQASAQVAELGEQLRGLMSQFKT